MFKLHARSIEILNSFLNIENILNECFLKIVQLFSQKSSADES